MEENKFAFNEYEVTTDDGYILTMFRIRDPKVKTANDAGTKSPVVFLQHGFLSSADCFIGHTPDKAPAFQLAREGYDVWLGNNRGNMHSRKHTTLQPLENHDDKKKYFSYSFQELGDFDLPAQIDYTLKATGASKLTYIGHSQGTTQMYYALTKMEDTLKEKVNLFIAFAPVVTLKNTKDGAMKTAAENSAIFELMIKKFGMWELFGTTWKNFQHGLCGKMPFFCVIGEIAETNAQSEYNVAERVLAGEGKFPQPGSWKELIHFTQLQRSGWF